MSRLVAKAALVLPLETLFNYFDLKLGSEIITYFALFNKVAGFYGLLAIFFGGNALSLDQLLLYLYSIASIAGIVWGLRAIWDENVPQTLFYAHLYSIDHIVATLSTLYFGTQWYKYTPHDGRRVANSDAQKAILEGSNGDGDGGALGDTDIERAAKALQVWQDERGFSTMVLVLGWIVKIYFILILYSYAHHLRRGTFRSLYAAQQAAKQAANGARRPSAMNGGYSHLRNTSVASTSFGAPEHASEGSVLWEESEETDTPLNRGSKKETSDSQGDIGESFAARIARSDGVNNSRRGSLR